MFVCSEEAERENRNEHLGLDDVDEVRAPLPVIREALYDDPSIQAYEFLPTFGIVFSCYCLR